MRGGRPCPHSVRAGGGGSITTHTLLHSKPQLECCMSGHCSCTIWSGYGRLLRAAYRSTPVHGGADATVGFKHDGRYQLWQHFQTSAALMSSQQPDRWGGKEPAQPGSAHMRCFVQGSAESLCSAEADRPRRLAVAVPTHTLPRHVADAGLIVALARHLHRMLLAPWRLGRLQGGCRE